MNLPKVKLPNVLRPRLSPRKDRPQATPGPLLSQGVLWQLPLSCARRTRRMLELGRTIGMEAVGFIPGWTCEKGHNMSCHVMSKYDYI